MTETDWEKISLNSKVLVLVFSSTVLIIYTHIDYNLVWLPQGLLLILYDIYFFILCVHVDIIGQFVGDGTLLS